MTVRDGNYQDRIIEDAPTFYWRLDNDYTDAMGNADVGVAVSGVFGAPKYGVASATVNGTDGYINIPHHALMNLSTNIDFSVEFWAKRTANALLCVIVEHRNNAGSGWRVRVNNVDALYLTLAATNFVGPTFPEDGAFHHVAVVVTRSTNVIFYLDNVATVVATVPNQNIDAGTNQTTIGATSYTPVANVWLGSIDEVAVYRKALTAADVDRHYKAGNKKYSGNVARIDTVGFDIDIAEQMFGLSDAPIQIKRINFYDPTAGDKAVLRDKAGNIVAELLCLTTNDDVELKFEDETLRCQGLKLLAADNTQTTGHLIITFA